MTRHGPRGPRALAYECPTCGALPNAGCTYVGTTATNLDQRARHGQPMRMWHHARLNLVRAADDRADRDAAAAARRARDARLPRPTPDLARAVRCMTEWDRTEYVALRDWMHEHGARVLVGVAS